MRGIRLSITNWWISQIRAKPRYPFLFLTVIREKIINLPVSLSVKRISMSEGDIGSEGSFLPKSITFLSRIRQFVIKDRPSRVR
jgi:hypothetical protein